MPDADSEQCGVLDTENIRKEQYSNREPSAYGSTDSDDLNNSDDSDDSGDSIDPKELKNIARFYKAQKRKFSLSREKKDKHVSHCPR